MQQEYDILSLSGKERVVEIFNIFHKNGNNKSMDLLQWQYMHPPAGEALTVFARSAESGEYAAVYSIFPVEFRFRGRSVIGSQSLDTLTDSGHRGKGLFIKIAEATYKAAQDQQYSFVYGFPNSASGPGFFNKLKWVSFGYPPFKLKLFNLLFPLKYKFGLNVYLSNPLLLFSQVFGGRLVKGADFQILENDDFLGEDYDDLWQRFSSGIETCIERKSSYMEWRYFCKPNSDYRNLVARDVNGLLLGVLIYTTLDKHGGRIGYLMDLIVDPDRADVSQALLHAVSRVMQKSKLDAALAWVPSDSPLAGCYRKSAFWGLPRRLQPIKLHFGIRLFNEGNVASGESFFVSYSDSDTV